MPIKKIYLLLDDIFWYPTSYLKVSFKLFFWSSDKAHHFTYDWLLHAGVDLIQIWKSYFITKFLTRYLAMPAYGYI